MSEGWANFRSDDRFLEEGMGRPSVTSPHSFVSLLLLILSYEKQNVYSREEVFPELSGKGPECELETPI